jgi:uncharacterized repeat protein (TIGR01451 family)
MVSPVPYWAAQSGPGAYTFTFGSAVPSVLLTIEGLNPGEYATIEINGTQVYLADCNAVNTYTMCPTGGIFAAIENGVINGPATQYGGMQLVFTPAGGITSFKVWCNGTMAGADFYLSFNPTANMNPGNIVANNFSVCLGTTCATSQIVVSANNYTPSLSARCYFGDGEDSLFPLTSANTLITHNYGNTGIYSIKNVLLNGATPVDSMFYSYDYRLCNSIVIKNYYDQNGNCNMDGNENYTSGNTTMEIDSNGIAIDTVMVSGGFYYKAIGNQGDVYQFKVLSPPTGMQLTCPASGVITDTLQGGVSPTQYFGYTCGNGFDLAVHATVWLSGIYDEIGNIYVHSNNPCYNGGATLKLICSPKYKFNGDAMPNATSFSGNTATWAFNNIGLSAEHITYTVWYASDPLTIGDTVGSYFSISPMTGDADTSNNIDIIVDTVRGGCDPNEMWVVPQGLIQAGTRLKYTINFENTGNDTAYNIHVMDTLSDNVDMRTFKLIGCSAPMNINMYNYNGHNIVKFDLPHINLLDSSHHDQCNGYVSYYVNAKEGLPYGTTIFNRAGVYFDYNNVVMTNTVEDEIWHPENVQAVTNGKVSVYPNPASDVLTVVMDKVQYSSLAISNSVGQEVLQQAINNAKTNIDISKLPAGVYYVNLTGGSGSVVKKFVKM